MAYHKRYFIEIYSLDPIVSYNVIDCIKTRFRNAHINIYEMVEVEK